MPKFQIKGVDRDTGDNANITIPASDEKAALNEAADLGIMVSSINQWAEKQPRKVKAKATQVPSYWAMEIGGHLVSLAGILSMIVGAGLAVDHVVREAGNESTVEQFGVTYQTGGISWAFLGTCLGIFVTGIFQVAVGQSIQALRDIARNSWG